MKFFVDSASLSEIKKFSEWGVVDGVTTNQKIFSLEKGVNFEDRVRDICRLVSGPVSIETTGRTVDELLEEGRYFSKLAPNIVVKVAMYKDGTGLKVVSRLHDEGIRTNMTVLMTTNQAALAAKAGADYVSIFYRRVTDSGGDPVKVIRETRELLDTGKHHSEIIVGSIREPIDVSNALVAGGHIVTVPPKIFDLMPFHQKSEETIEEFDRAWQQFKMSMPVENPARK